MPEKSQTMAIAGYDAERIQSIAYGALQQLNWDIKYASQNMLVAYTPRNWKKYELEITVDSQDNQLSVSSKMINNEILDMLGRNKKAVTEFLAAFETVKAKATDLNTAEWKEKITQLQENTIKAAGEEIKQAQEIDMVMNFSKSNLYLTYGIIGMNVLVFLLMAFGGVSLFAPTGIDIIHWGANFGPLTLSGDWWRLLSCVFVHIGIIHLAFNMYALLMAGIYLEPLLGKTRFVVAYLSTGVFASLASLWWHNEPTASAGASGAIFGMYGVFLALLSTNLIPKQIKNSLLQSIGIFVVYNLIYGMKSGVDNSAHVGGLLSGLVIGYLYYLGLKGENAEKKKIPVIAAIAVITVVAAFMYLDSKKVSADVREKAMSEINMYEYEDAGKFNDTYNTIIEMQNKAIVPLQDTTLSDEQLVEKLKTISLPEWEKADIAVKELKTYNVSDKAKQKAEVMQRYIDLRKEQIRLIRKLIEEKDETVNPELSKVNEKVSATVDELDRL